MVEARIVPVKPLIREEAFVPRGKNLPFCGRRSKRTGVPCRNKVVTGQKTCRMHGCGTRKRVLDGTRKPAGRPVVTGEHADPKRTRYDSLGRLEEEWRNSPELRLPDKRLALMQAALDLKIQQIKDGSFNVLKAQGLPEDKLTWLLQHVGLVIDKINKVNALTFREPIKAAVTLMEPALRMFGDILEKYVTDPSQCVAARQDVQERLSRIMVPIG